MDIDNELEHPLVAVSGGTGDIGMAIAQKLAVAGADVAICDISDKPNHGEWEANWYHGKVDVTDANAVDEWYEKVGKHFGRTPNLVISNAGVATMKQHLELSPDEWRRELDVNLNGAFYFTDAGVRRLVATGRPGRVVFIGSWAAHAPHRKLPAYSASKAGLRMLSKTLALELAEHGILVNEVAPGYVDCGMSGRKFSERPNGAALARAKVPIQKLISADEVAAQVLFLCSSHARQITGTTLLQDGGLSLLQGPAK
jgi:glucose 1-dehydrogenase